MMNIYGLGCCRAVPDILRREEFYLKENGQTPLTKKIKTSFW